MNRKLRSMLQRCCDQFGFYAQQHRAKVPATADTLDKAEVNEQLARAVTAALDGDVDVHHQRMVATLKKDGEAIREVLTAHEADALHMTLGLVGEAGELADAIKKWAIYRKDLDRNNVVEELGDIEFFLEGLRQITGVTRDETLEANMEKLGVRYAGYRYSDQRAIDRADKA